MSIYNFSVEERKDSILKNDRKKKQNIMRVSNKHELITDLFALLLRKKALAASTNLCSIIDNSVNYNVSAFKVNCFL